MTPWKNRIAAAFGPASRRCSTKQMNERGALLVAELKEDETYPSASVIANPHSPSSTNDNLLIYLPTRCD
jgi:hypothetical protein